MSDATHPAPGQTGPSPPLVGRAAERVLLNEQLSAMEAGHGNVVIIGGEAGIGKTAVARDLTAHARARGYPVITGHCYDLMAAPPYGLWLDLAERYAHSAREPDMPPLPGVLASRSLEGITSQSAFFVEIDEFLRAVASARPAVVVLEDVHWADPASLELLRRIGTHASHLPLLLVVTYREDELTRQNPFYQQLPALVRESEGLRLDLKRLTRVDLDALVTQGYDLAEQDRARLVTYLAEHAEGNPFFVMELLRALVEQENDGLMQIGNQWTLGELDRIIVPPLVRQVIDTRVERLGESTRIPLTISAVIGHEVSLDLLASITGMPADALYAVIDTAIEWHLLTATPDGTGVQFAHALTREALYSSIPPHRRRLLHQQVAETLEAMPHAETDAIAYHFQQAGDPRAVGWLTKAGDRAQRAYAWLTAYDRFTAAAQLLERTPGSEGTRARLLYRCGRLQRYSSAPAAIENLHTAARLAEIAGDEVLAADAIYSRGLVQCFADAWQAGLSDMSTGVAILESLPPDKAYIPQTTANWMADALPMVNRPSPQIGVPGDNMTAIGPIRHRSLPWFLAAGGRIRESLTVAESYKGLLSEADMDPLALANAGHSEFGRGMALASLGDPGRARSAFDHARESYRRLDHHAVLAFVDITELIDVMIPYHTNDITDRRRVASDAEMSIDRARGAIANEVLPDRAQLMNMFLDGRWGEACRIATECRSHGTYILRRPVTHTVVQIAFHQGDADAAWEHILALLPQGPDTEPGSAVLLDALMLQRIAACLCLDAGDMDGADRWLRANDRWLAWSGSVLGRADHLLVQAERHRASGDAKTARNCVDRAIAAASSPSQPLALLRSRRLRGELAMERGEQEVAEEDLTSSLILATRCEIVIERAQSLFSLARLHSTADLAVARSMVGEALDIGRKLDAKPLVAQVERLLHDISTEPSWADLPAGLTRRELDVLRLVAQGMTDAEVGGTLSISSRTVSQHLRSVYSKLNVRSRLEATRFLIDHHLV